MHIGFEVLKTSDSLMSWNTHGEGEHCAFFFTNAAYMAHESGQGRFNGQVAGDVRAQDYDRGDHMESVFEAPRRKTIRLGGKAVEK